jgi:hypothetical protein
MLQLYVLTSGRSVTAFLAPPRSQRPGQGPRSPHPKAGPDCCESKDSVREGSLILVGIQNTPHTKNNISLWHFADYYQTKTWLIWAISTPTLNPKISINRRNMRSSSPAHTPQKSQFTKPDSCRNCFLDTYIRETCSIEMGDYLRLVVPRRNKLLTTRVGISLSAHVS